jgi:hypothetical protein
MCGKKSTAGRKMMKSWEPKDTVGKEALIAVGTMASKRP